MNSLPLISVIIPTHNHAHFLPECIASVKAQTYSDYELIVVDNGSTDNTADLIRGLGYEKLRYHYQEDSGSVAGSRNTGIRLARGKYIAFLDSDDLWYRHKLAKVMSILEQDAGIDIIAHDMIVSRKNKAFIQKCGPAKKNMFKALLAKNRLIGSAAIVKRSVLLEIGGFDGHPDFMHVEDYEAWLRMAYAGKRFYFLHQVLGEYRFHDANLSLDFIRVSQSEINLINKHFKNFKSSIPLYSFFFRRKRIGISYFNRGVQYCFRKRYPDGLRYISASFLLNPFYLFSGTLFFIGRLIKPRLAISRYGKQK